MWFNDEDYKKKGTYIKWNPAVKTKNDQQHILKAVLDNRIDIATDHAPTRLQKKRAVISMLQWRVLQHALVALFEMHAEGKISIEDIVRKLAMLLRIVFQIKDRGYLKKAILLISLLLTLQTGLG